MMGEVKRQVKRRPSYMLMWLNIQPYQSQLKNNIIKNKNNRCEANDMGVTINNRRAQIIGGKSITLQMKPFITRVTTNVGRI
jgi:hypothetical protein